MNPADEFMIEEYKQIANGYQDLHAQQNELIKFYLSLVAVPATVLAVVAQFTSKLPETIAAQSATPVNTTPFIINSTDQAIINPTTSIVPTIQANILDLPVTPPALLPLVQNTLSAASPIEIISLVMPILIALLVGLSVIGYAVVRALIALRWEALLYVKTVNGIRRYFVENDQGCKLYKYLVLPNSDTEPKFWEGPHSRAFWNVLMVAFLNGVICFATIYAILHWLRITQSIAISTVAAFLWFFIQICIYYNQMDNYDRDYVPKFESSYSIENQTIGVDLDGVLGNLAEGVIEYAYKRFNLRIELNDIKSYRLQECTPLTETQCCEIFTSTDIFQSLSIIPYAIKALDVLHSKNWTIHVLSDRFWGYQDWSIAKTWLNQNGLQWDFLNLIRAKEKALYAKTYGLNIFVEDNYDTAISLSSVCEKVYLIDWPYNQGRLPENVIRVNNWNEILHHIL